MSDIPNMLPRKPTWIGPGGGLKPQSTVPNMLPQNPFAGMTGTLQPGGPLQPLQGGNAPGDVLSIPGPTGQGGTQVDRPQLGGSAQRGQGVRERLNFARLRARRRFFGEPGGNQPAAQTRVEPGSNDAYRAGAEADRFPKMRV